MKGNERGLPVREWDHRELHSGEIGTVGDWSCCARVGGPSALEYTPRDEIALQRAGFYRKHLGERVVSADPNHAIFFNRGEEYRMSHPVDGGDACTLLRPKAEILGEFTARTARVRRRPSEAFPVQRVWLDQRTFAIHCLLLRVLRRDRGSQDPVQTEELVAWLLDRVLRAAAQAANRECANSPRLWTHDRAVDRVKEFLSENYKRVLTLADIASVTPYSPFHLCRIFRNVTGLPIHRYLVQLRLRAALDRLFDARDRLSHLAIEVGFSSHSHFTSTFRRALGVTPSAVGSATELKEVRAIADAFQAAEIA